MGDGLMQRMSRGRDQWQLNVHGLSSLNNVTARSSDQGSFQSRMQSSTHEKKGFSWKQKKVICFSNSFSKKRTILKKKKTALMAFAETETKVIKILLPLVHTRHVKRFPGREVTRCSNNIDATTLESSQMPTHTLELSTARENAKTVRLHVVKGATSECMTALDMPSLHNLAWESTTMAVTFCASVAK